MHKLAIIALLASCTQSVQKPEKVPQIEVKRVKEMIEYIYPSGATGSVPFDWETNEKGTLITVPTN